MTNKFVRAMKAETSWTRTENNALALGTTGSSLLDLFGVIGSLRTRSESEIVSLFEKAFEEDRLLATKMSFYGRDIRKGGLGERRTIRVIWKWLANNHPKIMKKNLHLVPEFGRWDDLYAFVDTPVERAMWKFVGDTFASDAVDMYMNKPITMLTKWLKSVNTSSKESRRLGKLTAKALGLSESQYRKALASVRAHLNVVETKMTKNNWNEIYYPGVPSKAMTNYRKAFSKHDPERFKAFIESVKKGEAKINSSTLYPYDILERMGLGWDYNNRFEFKHWDEVLEEQWKALPNYVEGEHNVLVMADTSGSMMGRPMHTSLGLAMYFAERNTGPFHNVFLTFSTVPSFATLTGKTLKEKVRNIRAIVANTNLESAFNLVLRTAINNGVTAEEMPKAIIIISDMEIDQCTDVRKWTFYKSMQNRFAQHGYTIPNIVFWNVDSRHDVFHAQSDYAGVQLASGQSPSVFRSILASLTLTPYEAMLKTLSNKAYDKVTV